MLTEYTDFDFEVWQGQGNRPDDYRSPFQIDRDRIIHSRFFRNLQSKTQVFQAGQFDFYRTRLTHSLEVAQIGRSICCHLNFQNKNLLHPKVDQDLVEAICLAHDIGHPPFGHAGETALHEWMQGWGGFEGNAQSLRIVTDLLFQSRRSFRGMKPTRAFLDGLMKYKFLLAEKPDAARHFIYDEQLNVRNFIIPTEHDRPENWNSWKSLECQIMDWADDAAYSTHDLVDGIRAGFITLEKLSRWRDEQTLDELEKHRFEQLCKVLRDDAAEGVFALALGRFITATSLTPATKPLSTRTLRHAWSLHIDPDIQRESAFYKKIAVDLVFRTPQLQQLEHQGRYILKHILDCLWENYTSKRPAHLVNPDIEKHFTHAPTPQQLRRLICDHAASMTDTLAANTYNRLFNPGSGSIVDIL